MRHTWFIPHWPLHWRSFLFNWWSACSTQWWLTWAPTWLWWWTSLGASHGVNQVQILDCWHMQQAEKSRRSKVFVLIPWTDIPHGQWPLQGKLVCKQKCNNMGKIARYKVHHVAKGFAQWYRIDYNKTMAPTVQLEAFCTILHIAATLNWDLKHFDIKMAFLHSVLPDNETMYMWQPPGFEVLGKEDWVMKMQKSIYGMKQAGRIWNQTFHKVIPEWGFEHLQCKWCIYHHKSPQELSSLHSHRQHYHSSFLHWWKHPIQWVLKV